MFDVEIEEVEYLRHGDTSYLARVFKPRGAGPFPAMVEAHGGAWVQGARTNNEEINRRVAARGAVIAALDFRNPPEATYPGSVADINFGVRWLKSQAARFNTRPDLVGTMGTSSGGHLAVLVALKPHDPRYAAIAGDARFDARVPFVVSLWPVICPLGRYRTLMARGKPGAADYQVPGGTAQLQMRYWLTEAAMEEGSATLAVTRGDPVERPAILLAQNENDPLHPRVYLDQFVSGYRARGGEAEVEMFTGEPYDIVRSAPDDPRAVAVFDRIGGFLRRQAAARLGASRTVAPAGAS